MTMKRLSRAEYDLMEHLIKSNQDKTMAFAYSFLKKYYKDVVLTLDYVYAKGDIPIALSAHLDTVFEKDTNYADRELLYDREKNIMWCPKGAGFDDKAGIFAIHQIVKDGLRPSIIFCKDEESGCLGATQLSHIDNPFGDLKYIIQLDRRGTSDCVFYNCDNDDFVEYVSKFGFVEAIGSFTDICEFCPTWKIAGVNLSIGYEHEHTTGEILYVSALFSTIEKVKRMLRQDMAEVPAFQYIPTKYGYPYYSGYHGWGSYGDFDYDGYDDAYDDWYYHSGVAKGGVHKCEICGEMVPYDKMMKVQNPDGPDIWMCEDCAIEKVQFCSICNEAFLIDPKHPEIDVCPACERQIPKSVYSRKPKVIKTKKHNKKKNKEK